MSHSGYFCPIQGTRRRRPPGGAAKAREGAAARLPPRPPHGPRAPLRNRRVSRAARPARSRFRRRRRASQRRLRRSAVWGPNPATSSGRARPKPRRDTAPCIWDARGRSGCANARRGRALGCCHAVECVPRGPRATGAGTHRTTAAPAQTWPRAESTSVCTGCSRVGWAPRWWSCLV